MEAFPGGTAAPRRARRRRPRPAGLPAQPRPPRRLGQHPRARAGRASTRDTPDPADGRIERDADGDADRHAARGRDGPRRRLLPADQPPTDLTPRPAARRRRYLHSLGITGWQDAIVGAYAGIRRPARPPTSAPARRLLTARVVGALWWDRSARPEQIAELVERRRERRRAGRFRATTREDHAGRRRARTSPPRCSTPYLDGAGAPTDNTGLSFVDPASCARLRDRARRRRLPGALPRPRRPGRARGLDASSAARARTAPADHRHHLAHLQVVDPDGRAAVRRARRHRQHAAAVGHPRAADGRADPPVPRRGARPAGSTRSATCCAPARRLAAGSDWPVSSPDPLQAIHVAVNRADAPGGGWPPTGLLLPEQALDLEHGADRVHGRRRPM